MIGAHPSGSRLGAALVVASLASVAAAWLGILTEAPWETAFGLLFLVFLFGTPIALLHALLFGLPAYLALRERWPLRRGIAALAGLVIGALPTALLSLDPGYEFYQQGQQVLVLDGYYTPAGWLSLLYGAAMSGLYGVVGGLAFWLVLSGAKGTARQ